MGLQQVFELLLGLLYGFEALFPEGPLPSGVSEQIREWARHAHRAVCLGKAIMFIALAFAAYLFGPH